MKEPIAYKEKDYLCEKCHWYLMIDSGYGYCRRFPPQHLVKVVSEYIKRFFLFSRCYKEYQYPCIGWNTIPCGEFKKDNPHQKKEK